MNTIAYLTDIHLDEEFPKSCGVDARNNLQRLLRDVDQRGIKNVIFGGDIGTPESNQDFFGSLSHFGHRLKITLGNHDTFSEAIKHYPCLQNAGMGELYHLEDDASCRFIYLDSSAERISADQLQWLKNNLTREKLNVIFIHHPILGVPTKVDQLYPLGGRDQIRDVLLDFGEPVAVFCGHYHMDDERTEGNIRQWITPAGSYQILKHEDDIETVGNWFAYRIITIEHQEIQTEIVSFSA